MRESNRMILAIKRFIRWINIDYPVKLIILNWRKISYFLRYGHISVENSIVFESFRGICISDSPLELFKVIKNNPRFSGYKFVWVLDNLNLEEMTKLYPDVKFVKRGSKDYNVAYASSRFWISNGVIPLHFKKKLNQRYIQCWHGTPLKKIGLDVEYDKNSLHSKRFLDFAFKLDSSRYDYIVSPSIYATDRFKTAFCLGNNVKIIEAGYPRNDDLCLLASDNKYRSNLKRKLGIDNKKKVILFCPTFRDELYRLDVKSIWYQSLLTISKIIGEDWVIIFRSHYYDASEIPNFDNIINVSKVFSVNDVFLASDCLISDYSSVIFDYSILDRPIYLFAKDYDKYNNSTRGMYFDISKKYGFNIYDDEFDLVTAIKEKKQLHKECSFKLKSDFCKNDDGFAASRVINMIIDCEFEKESLNKDFINVEHKND
ncbi:hypothetical protein DLR62_19365 [Vibrio tarriae]|nr:hypothetical protein DLR62_19365 [Vibrio tarriae]